MAKFNPPSPTFIGPARHRGGRQTPKAIVLHGTVSSDNAGTARNIALWWKGPTSPMSSAHYVVDPREVIQCVGDHTVAYHCGFNTGSIGVEFCDEQQGPANRWNDADSNAILKRAARLVAELALAYDIEVVRPSHAALRKRGPHGIYSHNDSRIAFGRTTHTDPRDFPWAKFLRMVKAEVKELRAAAEPSKPAPAPMPAPAPTKQPLKGERLEVISKNLGEVKAQRAAVAALAKKHRPHVFQLSECHQRIEVDGYTTYQGAKGEARGTALLVRDDVEVVNDWVNRMKRGFLGPKHLKRHGARVHRVVVLRLGKKLVRVGGPHFPPGGPSGGHRTGGKNRPAWLESWAWACKMLRKTNTVIVGDLNALAKELAPMARKAGVRFWAGTKVDHALTKGAKRRSVKRVDKAKVHPALRWVFEV